MDLKKGGGTHKMTNVRDTSIQCYKQIKAEGLLSKRKQRIFKILMDHGQGNGLTGTEISRIFKKIYPSTNYSEGIRNRITELYNLGVVYEKGTKQCQFTGRTVTIWDLTGRLPEKKEPIREVIQISIPEAEKMLSKKNKEYRILYPGRQLEIT